MPGTPTRDYFNRVDKCRTGCRKDSNGKLHRCAEHAKIKRDQVLARRQAAKEDKANFVRPLFITDNELIYRRMARNLADQWRAEEAKI